MNDAPDTRLSLIGRLHNKADSAAWSEFVQTYEPLILSIAQRRGLQYADAAEVAQEVLNRVATSIDQWDPSPQRGSFRGWLYRVTRNLTIDYLRRNRRWPSEAMDVDRLPAPDDEASREFRVEYERQVFAWAAQQVRPVFKPANWQAFWQSTVEEKPVDQVAEKLGLTRGQVYVARSRVMAKISQFIRTRLDETAEF